jgi:hypothetical protein
MFGKAQRYGIRGHIRGWFSFVPTDDYAYCALLRLLRRQGRRPLSQGEVVAAWSSSSAGTTRFFQGGGMVRSPSLCRGGIPIGTGLPRPVRGRFRKELPRSADGPSCDAARRWSKVQWRLTRGSTI